MYFTHPSSTASQLPRTSHPIPLLCRTDYLPHVYPDTVSPHHLKSSLWICQAKTKGAHPQQVGLFPGEQVPGLPGTGTSPSQESSATFYSQAGRIEIAPKALLPGLGPPGSSLQTTKEGCGHKGLKLPSSLLPKPSSVAVSGPALVIKPGLTEWEVEKFWGMAFS